MPTEMVIAPGKWINNGVYQQAEEIAAEAFRAGMVFANRLNVSTKLQLMRRIKAMTPNSKIGAIAMITALLGGTAGAFIGRTTSTETRPIINTATKTTDNQDAVTTSASDNAAPLENQDALNTSATNEQTAFAPDSNDNYRNGFAEGYRAARNETTTKPQIVTQRLPTTARNSYVPQTATRTRYVNSAPQTSYNDNYRYNENRYQKRGFWDKHRDKLTVAMGTGGGALLGGLIGGKKGAAIGAISGGAGSAIYTYKIRKKDRRY